ncbi:MAG TPA: ribosome biogenesis GTP-binding protein YihA/YsxC [Saprospiraceae bacterium]|nr:ribosome biogenesis GTP-binding protein YihA/YsxC [Saprospiraceae bacterium]
MWSNIHHIEFEGSYGKWSSLKPHQVPEFCFWGRSNVGKSSLLNMLCHRKDLARTSATPGKTQTFNLYKSNLGFNFMDLPGYGFAQVSRNLREQWQHEIQAYLSKRENLCCIFLLIDISIPPQKIDLETISKIGHSGWPLILTLTKADKVKPMKKSAHILALKDELKKEWEKLPVMIETSSESGLGKAELLEQIYFICQEYNRSQMKSAPDDHQLK